MKNSLAVIQARMGSTRLPGKALFPLAGGVPALKCVIDRVLASRVERVVVATPAEPDDQAIFDACESWGVDVMATA